MEREVAIRPVVISAPFGNYVRPRGATPTLGTFTAARRPGRVWRVLRTVRYSRRMGAWVNKIGLRNPGIDWLAGRVREGKEDVRGAIVSVHGFADDEWRGLLDKAGGLGPLAVELNMSCPNVGEVHAPAWLFEEAAGLEARGVGVVVKLPPVRYRAMLEAALGAGLRRFHCCNTLPVPAGGVSGKPLKPVSLAVIEDVLTRAGEGVREELDLIGGGGITTRADIDEYASVRVGGVGVRHVALGTKVMHPRYLFGDGPARGLIEHAEGVLGG